VTLQALISSFIAGYIRNVEIISGVKYAVVLATIALVAWVIVEQISDGNTENAEALLLLAAPAGWSLWGQHGPTGGEGNGGAPTTETRSTEECITTASGTVRSAAADGERGTGCDTECQRHT